MTLKTKRNLPLILLLIAILLFMAVGMGNQISTSYTITPATVQAWASNFTSSLMAAQ
jgi:ABC-type methionine transport system permease subunit